MSIRPGIVGVAALALMVGACGGSAVSTTTPAEPTATTTGTTTPLVTLSPTATLAPSPTTAPTATPIPTQTAPPVTQTFSLNSQVWWSGYAITVTGGTYDSLKHTLDLDATFTNQSTQATELRSVSDGVRIVWNGQFLAGFVTPGTDPVGATVNAKIQTQLPAGFVVADASLAFGQPDEHQAIVPLNGDTATSDQPISLAVPGTVKMGKYVTYKFTKAMLIPASCSGYPDRFRFGPLKTNLISIVLWGTATNSDPLNYAQIDRGFLKLPDLTTQTSNPPIGLSIPNRATLRDEGICFAVPAPATGSYTLSMH